MERINLEIAFEKYNLAEVSDTVRQLIEVSRQARDQAYAVYSGFYVGAALELANGKIIPGSNQENRAYPSGLCAERVAMFAAGTQYPGVPFVQMAIAVKSINQNVLEPVSPCGSCRQVMAEYELKFNQPMIIWLVGNDDTTIKVHSVKDLLPLMFTGEGVRLI